MNLVGASRPRPGYCFRCGEEGHIADHCENNPDPSKVARKKQFVEGEASPMGLAEPSEVAAGKLQAVFAVVHVENGGESQCPKQDPKTLTAIQKVP